MQINFYPEYNNPSYETAAREYSTIWETDGERIVASYKKITGLDFTEDVISAVVFEGISHSSPLQLRASLTYDQKKAALVHELAHRLIVGNKLNCKIDPSIQKIENHKQLDLILYDVWVDLYGEAFARDAVVFESRIPDYKVAWDWALTIPQEKRLNAFLTHFDQFK